jgi:hypothetical protein
LATPFSHIYENFLARITDFSFLQNSFANLPAHEYYSDMYAYLKMAIGDFISDCYKDIANHEAFSCTQFLLVGNGGAAYTLSPAPPTDETLTYVEVDGVEVEGFERDGDDLTLDDPVGEGIDILVATYKIGQFTVDLNLTEINILANMMVVPFLQRQLYNTQILSQSLYSPDWRAYSPAELAKQINEAIKLQRSQIEYILYKYSYGQNPDNLAGLRGGSGV